MELSFLLEDLIEDQPFYFEAIPCVELTLTQAILVEQIITETVAHAQAA